MDRFFLAGTIGRQLGLSERVAPPPSLGELLGGMMRQAQLEDRPGVDEMTRAIHASMDPACLIVGEDGGRSWVGSGFLVQDGVILTVAHVLPEGDKTVHVSFDGESFIPAIAVARNVEYDVGCLQLTRPVDIKPASLAPPDRELLPGEQIAVIGSPEGWENVVTVGRISAIGRTPRMLPDPSWKDMIFIDADILEGSSGSMVIDASGQVLGMVMGLIGQHVNDFGNGQRAVIPIPRILDALKPEGGGTPAG